jgi:hypothetical protein
MRKIIASALLLSLGACSFIARGEDQYREDTRALLETKNADIKACYDRALASNPAQSGNVVVNFTVEKKTGALMNVAADPDQSTAPPALQNCVVSALEGLALTPEDRRDGQATFSWVFRGGGGKSAM